MGVEPVQHAASVYQLATRRALRTHAPELHAFLQLGQVERRLLHSREEVRLPDRLQLAVAAATLAFAAAAEPHAAEPFAAAAQPFAAVAFATAAVANAGLLGTAGLPEDAVLCVD